jgi:hypothetical protein
MAVHVSVAVEQQAVPWKKLWQVELPQTDVDCLPLDVHLPFAMLTPWQLRATIATYSWTTSVGAEFWAPRHIGLLSDGLLGALIEMFELHIRSAVLHAKWNSIHIFLIPHAEVDVRPIGVFGSLVRILDRYVRKSYTANWMARIDNVPHFGASGRSVERAVWSAAAMAEWCVCAGRKASTFLLDISKAFENIEHSALLEAAAIHGYNVLVVRWLLCLYQADRVLSFQEVLSKVVRASRSVVPGSSNADLCMKLMLLTTLGGCRAHFPTVQLSCVVDDVRGLAHGPIVEGVARLASEAAQYLLDVMQNVLIPHQCR